MEAQARQRAIIKEVYVGLVGWAWIATCLAAVYFLVAALFFKSSWWHFVLCVVGAWMLYRVALYYRLEREGRTPVAPSAPWTAPSDETYYLGFKNGGTRKVHIQDRDEVEAYVLEFNARAIGDGVIVRVVSQSLQKQRLATGRDGVVWPESTPVFYVHFSDEVVSELNLDPTEADAWGDKWRSYGAVEITEICDTYGYVIWPERDGSRVF